MNRIGVPVVAKPVPPDCWRCDDSANQQKLLLLWLNLMFRHRGIYRSGMCQIPVVESSGIDIILNLNYGFSYYGYSPEEITLLEHRWVYPIFLTGWRNNRLDMDDMYRCSQYDESEHIVKELEK
ncbi:unnamed protein product [Oppiella nova]|uniref:Uncharacterized protein n=1 Tax=Oppiella nova TaxID=334625 RepID=A0A7R9LJ24_9ACAR|nr:unnamed protein product [Oppiella nova]CAG2164136.1 unnamed protein product [Oppiella nova]